MVFSIGKFSHFIVIVSFCHPGYKYRVVFRGREEDGNAVTRKTLRSNLRR